MAVIRELEISEKHIRTETKVQKEKKNVKKILGRFSAIAPLWREGGGDMDPPAPLAPTVLWL